MPHPDNSKADSPAKVSDHEGDELGAAPCSHHNPRLRTMTPERPTIVCLCGSTRFIEAFRSANLHETIAGKIVLSIGCDTKSDTDLLALGELTEEAKAALDELHKRKIDLADEVLVLNVGGYVGSSTRSEIEYARLHGKPLRWLEPESAASGANDQTQQLGGGK